MFSFKQQYIFVLAIPIINVIADSIQDYFQPGLASPGYIRALLIMLFIFFTFKNYYKNFLLNNIILFSLAFYFILSLFSSDIIYSQGVYFKYFIASMMFPVGYHYFGMQNRFRNLLKIFILTLGIYIFFLIISNIFFLGSSDYLAESIYFGAGRVNMTKSMMILVLISPLSIKFERNINIKRIYIFIVVIAIIFIMLGVKRSAIIGLFIGYFVYFIFTPQKTKVTKGLFLIGLILFLASPLYFDRLSERVEARQEAGRFEISEAQENEGRIIEIRRVIEAFIDGDISYKLFGAELFNSSEYFGTKRMLHIDYTTILAGTGLLGFSLFILIYGIIFLKALSFYKKFKFDKTISDIMAVSITLVIAVMIAGFSGTVTAIGLRAIAFLFWGAALAFAKNELKMRVITKSFDLNH